MTRLAREPGAVLAIMTHLAMEPGAVLAIMAQLAVKQCQEQGQNLCRIVPLNSARNRARDRARTVPGQCGDRARTSVRTVQEQGQNQCQ